MFDTAIGGDRICSATQAAELPQNARQDQPGWVARNAGSATCGRAAGGGGAEAPVDGL